jgi:PAS domain S-box-containing protein
MNPTANDQPSPLSLGTLLDADWLLDTLPWAVLVVDAQRTVRRINHQAVRWFSVRPATLLGRPLAEVALVPNVGAALEHLLKPGETPPQEVFLPQSEQWITLAATQQPGGWLIHGQDITLQKQREQQYQALAENTPDVLTRWTPDLRLRYANAAFAAKAGQPLSALLGRPFTDMGLPAEVTGPYQAVLQRVFATGQPQAYYNVFPGPYGPVEYYSRLVPELRDGQLETVLGIARDISELKRTEAETLRLREALGQQVTDRYQALLYAMDEGFCVIELTFDASGQQVVDYVYRELNPVFARQSGLPAEALGQSVRELVPDLEPIWFDIYGQVARTGEPTRLERQVPQLERWFELHAYRVGGPGSHQVAVLFHDITARKHTEATLRRAAEATAFRLQLADALGPLTEAVGIQEVVTHLARRHFGADRCYYCEITNGQAIIRRDAAAPGLPLVAGTYPLADFALLQAVIEAGQPFSVPDVRQAESVDENLHQLCGQLRVISYLNVPVVKNGATVGVLCLGQGMPREWATADVDLAGEVAERTWVAVERARVEAALRDSEARLQVAVDAADLGTFVWHVADDRTEEDARARVHFGLPPHSTVSLAEALVTTFHPDDGPRYAAAVARAVDPAGPGTLHEEFRVRHPDGQQRWLAVTATAAFAGTPRAAARLTGVLADITVRKHHEQRQQFLLQLSDRLRPLADPLAVQLAALQLVGEELRLDRVLYNEIDPNVTTYTVRASYVREGFLAYGGEQPMGPFTESVRALQRGITKVVYDVETDESFSAEERAICAGIRVRAFVIVPLIKGGRWLLNLVAHASQPRRWPAYEIALLEETAERTWAAVERANVAEALRNSEAQLVEFNGQLERKVAQRTQALQESQQLLQSVYDTTLIGLAVLHAVRDEATGAITDFTFISANKELARLSGRPNLAGRRYGAEFSGAGGSGMLALMVQAVETGQPQQTEFSYSMAGVTRWIAFMCVKLNGGVVATLLDITERKTAEQQLTRNLRLLEQAETVVQLGSWDYDLASGQIHWSGGMYGLFGLPLGQPVQPPIYLDYVLAEDRPQAEQLVQCLTSGAGDFETTLRLCVGEVVKTVRIKVVVVRDAQGQAERVLGVDLDISELQRLEADNLRLRLSQQQALFEAVQAAEEEERRRLSESLHNGIGQILYATKLQLDCLPDAPELSPRHEAARLLSEAIRQTRSLSHELTPALLEEFGLEKTLRSVCRTLSTPALHWHCHFVLEDTSQLLLPLQLAVYRLAQELAQNVVKHAQASVATLEAEVLPAWVVLRVEDNGRGFDPTHTSDGLGLRSLRSRVALLGGHVQLTTAPGEGTQCQIRLPLAPTPL